jgi:hypothetical protein
MEMAGLEPVLHLCDTLADALDCPAGGGTGP